MKGSIGTLIAITLVCAGLQVRTQAPPPQQTLPQNEKERMRAHFEAVCQSILCRPPTEITLNMPDVETMTLVQDLTMPIVQDGMLGAAHTVTELEVAVSKSPWAHQTQGGCGSCLGTMIKWHWIEYHIGRSSTVQRTH